MNKRYFSEGQSDEKEQAGHKREYTKENYLHNGVKSQGQFANNSFNTTLEEPALNESGVEAKKNGFGMEKK